MSRPHQCTRYFSWRKSKCPFRMIHFFSQPGLIWRSLREEWWLLRKAKRTWCPTRGSCALEDPFGGKSWLFPFLKLPRPEAWRDLDTFWRGSTGLHWNSECMMRNDWLPHILHCSSQCYRVAEVGLLDLRLQGEKQNVESHGSFGFPAVQPIFAWQSLGRGGRLSLGCHTCRLVRFYWQSRRCWTSVSRRIFVETYKTQIWI